MLVRPSPVGRHVVPLSSLFQTPPDTPAAKSVVGIVGWKRTTRVRPPMLPGPSGVQASSRPEAPAGSIIDTMRPPLVQTRGAGAADRRGPPRPVRRTWARAPRGRPVGRAVFR